MDSVLDQIANRPSVAAEPTLTAPDATGGVQDQGAVPSQAVPDGSVGGSAAPTEGLSPTAGIETQPPVAPTAPAQPAIDQSAYQEAIRKANERDQLVQELQQLALQADRQRQMDAERTQLQNFREQVRAQASAMDPADAITFIDRQYDQLLASQEQQRIQRENQMQQDYYARMVQATAPAYAEHLVNTHGLPAEYKQRLQMLSPMDMDRYLPVIKQEYAARQAEQANMQRILSELDQLKRSQQANAAAGTGAHVVGGSGSTPASANGDQFERGSRDHLESLLGQLF